MERISIGDGLDLSRIVYGMWRLGDDSDTSPRIVQAKIEACLAQGITSLDQADIYGGYAAENLLGDCFRAAPTLRDKVEIITKCSIIAPVGRYSDARVKYYDTSAAHIAASIDLSLKAMAIGQIDLLLIHRPDPFMDHHETGRALDAAVASGKVRAVGVSNFKPYDITLLQSAMRNKIVVNQIELSVIALDSFTNGDIAFAQERAILPMAWSPLAGGRLFDGHHGDLVARLAAIGTQSGVDATAVAIAWLLAHPAKIAPVLGTNNLARIGSLADAAKVPMDRQTWFELYSLSRGQEVA